jgi:predicted dehydrogenase
MYNVLIFGAGSIGNHLAHACRQRDWSVDLFDIDPLALERTQKEIYPSRYGSWDAQIALLQDVDYKKFYDLVIIGTPPDSHQEIAINILNLSAPKVVLIEKPLCTPFLERLDELISLQRSTQCRVLVGYNHNFTSNTIRAAEILRGGILGAPLSIHVRWLEHWGGIFSAHPWLNGPSDSYLGYWKRGGGACGEHSHAISLWQYFSTLVNSGPISEVTASMAITSNKIVEYDQIAQLFLRTKTGLVGSVTQDVVTSPSEKSMLIQGTSGFLEWRANHDSQNDSLRYGTVDSEPILERFPKTRVADFIGQMDHIQLLLDGSINDSPNALRNGKATMEIIAAAHLSNREKRSICLPDNQLSQKLKTLN